MNRMTLAAAAAALVTLAACGDTSGTGGPGAPRLIAQPQDTSFFDRSGLPQRQAAIAYDPDGCQNWLIDDGAEGYASRRRDPRSGLPVCDNRVPPGSVVKEYRTNRFPDILPQ